MSLQSRAQLENTRAKLKLLEARLSELELEPAANARTRELTRQSLKKLINQLKEEIVRFEAHEVQAQS
jgi:protein subunit release factor B